MEIIVIGEESGVVRDSNRLVYCVGCGGELVKCAVMGIE